MTGSREKTASLETPKIVDNDRRQAGWKGKDEDASGVTDRVKSDSVTSLHQSTQKKNSRHWCNLVLRNQLSALIINELVPPWITYLSEKHEVIKSGQPG